MENLRDNTAFCQLMELQRWQLKHADESDWQSLKERVTNCQRCGLAQNRTQTVFGVGDRQADLMIIGEAPGYYEDQKGEPFVGRAGELLNAMLKTMGRTRQSVYIANILKCRPDNNRDPNPQEVDTCTPYLMEQISLVNPKLILAVGRIAAHYLLSCKSSLESLRAKIHHAKQIPVPIIVTYHPAYLLRNPIDKRKSYIDLKFCIKTLMES